MTSVKMLLSYNNNEKVVQLPVVPNELPDVVQALNNTEFETHTRTLTLLGNKKPRSFSLDLFLPTQSYSFAAGSNGEEVIELLKYVTDNKIPARLVIVDNMTELLNIAVSVSSFQYRYDTVGNIRASVSLSEYVFAVDIVEDEDDGAPTFTELTVYYEGYPVTVEACNVDGSLLVYARTVLEFVGLEVGWNAEKKRVTAGGTLLDIHTELYSGKAYCYIREMMEYLGYEVVWNSEEKYVVIRDGD